MRPREQPGVEEIRFVFRLLNECREIWADPDAWQQHLLEAARDIIQGPVGQLQLMRPTREPDRPELIPLAWSGENERARRLYFASTDPAERLELPDFSRAVAPAMHGGAAGFTRRMVVPDESWYASRFYREYVAPGGLDEFGAGLGVVPKTGAMMLVGASRSIGAEPIPPVAAATLAILAEELAPMLGTTLALNDQTSMAGLTPRQRETLELLLDGLSEKEAAAEMGVKPSTIHSYVVELHRHFDVRSRGELLSYFVRRRAKQIR